jgi:hypothetical protein
VAPELERSSLSILHILRRWPEAAQRVNAGMLGGKLDLTT